MPESYPDGLSLRERDVLNAVALALGGSQRQPYSHVRGAIRVGVSPRTIGSVLLRVQRLTGSNLECAKHLLRELTPWSNMSARRLPANAQRLKQDYGSLIFSNRNCILNVEMQVCVHIIVQGMVQGVGFRYYVQRQAMKLNLSGFARNLYNGDVEIEAEGDRSLVEEFIKEVKVGPSSAYVKDLKIEWKEFQNRHKGFEVR